MSNFSDVEIELDQDQQKKLIEVFVRDILRIESQNLFDDKINDGNSIDLRNALYHAVLNDMIVTCIKEVIDTVEKNNNDI